MKQMARPDTIKKALDAERQKIFKTDSSIVNRMRPEELRELRNQTVYTLVKVLQRQEMV